MNIPMERSLWLSTRRFTWKRDMNAPGRLKGVIRDQTKPKPPKLWEKLEILCCA